MILAYEVVQKGIDIATLFNEACLQGWSLAGVGELDWSTVPFTDMKLSLTY